MLSAGKNDGLAGDIASLLGILGKHNDRQDFNHSLLSRLIAAKTNVVARHPGPIFLWNCLHSRTSSSMHVPYVEVSHRVLPVQVPNAAIHSTTVW